jgi:peptidoglycan/xylan/chitin deacetylase (PgdA/CDA1 family)
MLRRSVILAYHGVARVSREDDPRNLVVDPDRFLRQVGLLRRRGYTFVTVLEFAQHLDGGSAPPPGFCALTFDDGTADHAQVLPDLLARLDVAATLYVCPGLLNRPNPFLRPESGFRLMNAEELQAVAANPRIEIGSHTRTHAVLADATEEEAYEEMSASKTELEALIDRPVLTFAYPRCMYSAACPRAAERAGYLAAVTCGPRGGWHRYALVREMMDSTDSRLTFELKSRALWNPLKQSRAGRAAPWASAVLRRRQ